MHWEPCWWHPSHPPRLPPPSLALLRTADQPLQFCVPVWGTGPVLPESGVQHRRAGTQVRTSHNTSRNSHSLKLFSSNIMRPPSVCRLDEVGYGVGVRLLEVLCYRERSQRRETRLLDMLKFVHRCAAPSLPLPTLLSHQPVLHAAPIACLVSSTHLLPAPASFYFTSCLAAAPASSPTQNIHPCAACSCLPQHPVEVHVWPAGSRFGAEQHGRG